MTKRLLTPSEIKRADTLYNMFKNNKREFVERYGKDAEKVMRGRAIKDAKQKTKNMHKDKIKEMVKSALQTQPIIDAKEYLSKRDKNLKEAFNPTDTITMDVPLFIRMMEFAREDAKSDLDLHDATENATSLSTGGKTLTMTDYDAIVPGMKLNEDDWKQPDDESDMAHSQLVSIKDNADKLMNIIDPNEQLDAWLQAKLTKAQDYLQSAYDYLEGEEIVDEGLPRGFWAKKIPGGKMKETMYGNHEDNKRIEKEAIHLYNKGEELFLQGATEEAEDLRQQALDVSSCLNWDETDLPPYIMDKSTGIMDESYETLVKKLKSQGKSEKVSKAIAGAVASYKAKGGGKGPTAKQIKEEIKVGDTYEYSMAPGDTLTVNSIDGDDIKVTTLQKGKKYNGEETKSWIEMAIRQGLLKLAEKQMKEGKIDEKHLTPAEKKKKEDIVKAMKKTFKGPKPVMYAIATKKAEDAVEETLTKKIMSKLKSK